MGVDRYVPKCVPNNSSLTIVEPYGYNEYIEVTVLMSPWKGDLEIPRGAIFLWLSHVSH